MKRLILCWILVVSLTLSVSAQPIRWVDFGVPYDSLKYAMDRDIATFDDEKHISWIDILALSACRTGGKCPLTSVKKAFADLQRDRSPKELLGESYQYYDYYHQSFQAALGGLLGSYSINKDGQILATYGLKAFSPIAAGYGYSHADDFGMSRSFGFARKHLGNDLMGGLGTPIVAVEGGVVEAMGWNRYGGWRIGIRSFDSKRYYYYAHLQKDTPFAPGLAVGDLVNAGDLIGYMGRSGYSDRENTDNIEINIKIGGEDGKEMPSDCSLVTATYSASGVKIGTYGVIGPLRMDYQKVVSVLEGVGKILEDILTNK
jgi:hypothetical protein